MPRLFLLACLLLGALLEAASSLSVTQATYRIRSSSVQRAPLVRSII